jgi:hypothetical protein
MSDGVKYYRPLGSMLDVCAYQQPMDRIHKSILMGFGIN